MLGILAQKVEVYEDVEPKYTPDNFLTPAPPHTCVCVSDFVFLYAFVSVYDYVGV